MTTTIPTTTTPNATTTTVAIGKPVTDYNQEA